MTAEAADQLVGSQAKEWLGRARALEATVGRVADLHERAVQEVDHAITEQRVVLPGHNRLGGRRDTFSLAGAVAVVLEPAPRHGVIASIERWAPITPQLDAVALRVRQISRALRQDLPTASRTSGRLRFALSRQARKVEATQALSRVVSVVESADQSGTTDRCQRLLDQPPTDPPAPPFAVDPGYVLDQIARRLDLRPPRSRPPLLGQAELETAHRLVSEGSQALKSRPALVEHVRTAFMALQNRMIAAQLADIPVKALKDATDGRIRFKTLEDAGFRTVGDVVRANTRIAAVRGIGELTAKQVIAAARQVEKAVRDDLRFRIDLDRSDELVTALLSTLHILLAYDATFAGKGDELQAAVDFLRPLTAVPRKAQTVALFSAEAGAGVLTTEVQRRAEWFHRSGLAEQLHRIKEPRTLRPSPPHEVWQDFEARSADYYAALGKIVDLKMDDDAAAGFIPREIVDRVHAQELDDSLLRNTSLRGYQSFGARYALVQRKVVLGDEMGLGKTIQALAVMAHLRAGGKTHFLVVCPASVLINWVREVTSRSTLRTFHVHGPGRDHAWSTWQRQGGVAVTTFDTLRALPSADTAIALLTVDEAHYVKNPSTIRAQHVTSYVALAERTLFMTGTPMENRVEEFRQLIDYLQPAVARGLSVADGIAGGRRFRAQVAPVYLRRNTVDVLQELPDLVQTEQWEEFAPFERHVYRDEVAAGNFMAMRRVAFLADPRNSAKLERLGELVDEASGNGTKVIVFSYFRDVLDVVMTSLGSRAVGPLTGSVPSGRRQQMVDDFSKPSGPPVLVSQIQAGGVGLNMQAASVVILCEPQVKPSLEAQAIARAHRMGQVRNVQVYRLLTSDSVDQRMLEILDSKTQLFDEYARGSDVANLSPEAVDVSERQLARQVVAAEQERLANELAEKLAAEFPEDDG